MNEARALDRKILALALPAAGSAMLLILHRMIDFAWCRELGTEAVAALSISSIAVWLYASLGILGSIGLTALVARYAGAGRQAGARYVGSQGLRWAIAMGAAAALVGYALAPVLFEVAAAEPGVSEQGVAYARIYWIGGVFVLVQLFADAVFRGHGNTRVPFLVALVALSLNAVLDPLFIFGWGPLPALGVPGAAWATIVASVAGAALNVWALRRARLVEPRRPADDELRFDDRTPLGAPGRLGLDWHVFRRMTRVGLPAALGAVFFDAIYLVIMRIAERAGGAAAQAGLGVGHTGEGVAYVLGLGWASAAAALVGRHLGANEPDEAARVAWRAVLQCAVLSGLWGLVLFVFSEEVAWVFAEEAAAKSHAAAYYRIVSICLIAQAAELVLNGAFGGAGLTLPPTVVGVSTAVARIPLAYWAAFDLGLGPTGIWWVIALTALVRGVIVSYWFSRGTWKTRTV